MTTITWFIASTIASLTQSVTGFGFAIITMTTYNLYFSSIPEAAAVIGIVAASVSLSSLVKYRRTINFRLWLPLFFAYTITQFFAIKAVIDVDVQICKAILGLVLFVISVLMLGFKNKMQIKGTAMQGLIVGIISGISGGMFSISGPPIALYFLSATKNREEYMGTVSLQFFIGGVIMAISRLGLGILDAKVLPQVLVGLSGLIAGVIIAQPVSRKMNDTSKFKIVLYLFTGISGLWYIISFLIAI